MTQADKQLIDRLLKRNRRWAQKWAAFEDQIASELASILRGIEAGKRRLVLSFIDRLSISESGVIENTIANQRVVLKMIREVGGYNAGLTTPRSPLGKWISTHFEKSAVLGIRKAIDTVAIVDKAMLPAKGYQAQAALRLATKAQDEVVLALMKRGDADLDILRREFVKQIFDPNGTTDVLRQRLIDTGQIEGMLDSAGRRVTADERADRIARYEPQTISRMAHDEAINDFYYGGEAPGPDEQFRLWDAVMDARTTASHAARHQKVLTVEEWQTHDWGDGQYGLPPTRPRCRCDAIFVDPSWFSEETREKHFENRLRVEPMEQEGVASA